MLNSLPMTAAVSPDGRYLAVVNAGYGTFESRYQQSIAVLDIKTGAVTDFPDPRTASNLPQTMYSGLAFGKDGTHLYAVFDSLTAPEGKGKDETGNAIAVYNFSDGKVTPERPLPVPYSNWRRASCRIDRGRAACQALRFPRQPELRCARERPGRINCWWRITSPTMFC